MLPTSACMLGRPVLRAGPHRRSCLIHETVRTSDLTRVVSLCGAALTDDKEKRQEQRQLDCLPPHLLLLSLFTLFTVISAALKE